jgi:hypothetical protein
MKTNGKEYELLIFLLIKRIKKQEELINELKRHIELLEERNTLQQEFVDKCQNIDFEEFFAMVKNKIQQ